LPDRVSPTSSDNPKSSRNNTASMAHAHTFTFDYVYDQNATQSLVYETTARGIVDSSLSGYNATIFAYGQTGTGKTYTMEGFQMSDLQANHLSPNPNVEDRGIIPRAIEQIFGHIQAHASQTVRFLVRASYLQIYNEGISDLLKPERNNLAIREDKKKGVFVEGLSEWVVRSPAEIYGLMERGGAVRATGSTKMNEISSRSHAVFIIIVEQSQTEIEDDVAPAKASTTGKAPKSRVKQSFKVGKLNLVDLAGSERVRLSGATGQRLEVRLGRQTKDGRSEATNRMLYIILTNILLLVASLIFRNRRKSTSHFRPWATLSLPSPTQRGVSTSPTEIPNSLASWRIP